MKLFAERGVRFVPRGAGTGLSGGALADDVVLLGLHRLREIVSIDAENCRAVVEPGVVNATLSRAAAPYGLYYAPDPSSQTACTIGGNVAENAGGPHCLKYGVTLNHVLAVTALLPSGEIVTLGNPRGEMVGYDLLGAFVGSEGCFGIALDVTVRLEPLPQAVHTLLADFSSVHAAAQAVSAIIASGIVPAALELMDARDDPGRRGVDLRRGLPDGCRGDPADRSRRGRGRPRRGCGARVALLHRGRSARRCAIATDAADRTRLWQGRKKAFGAMGRLAPHLVVQDAVVPRTRLPEILATIDGIGRRHGVQVCNVFHAGDGNLHPNMAVRRERPGAVRARARRDERDHGCVHRRRRHDHRRARHRARQAAVHGPAVHAGDR